MEISEQAKEAVQHEIADAAIRAMHAESVRLGQPPITNLPDAEEQGHHVQQLLTSANQEKDAEINALRSTLQTLKKEAELAPSDYDKLVAYIRETFGFKGSHNVIDDLQGLESSLKDIQTLRSTVEELKKYVMHKSNCRYDDPCDPNGCTCGLSKPLEGIKR